MKKTTTAIIAALLCIASQAQLTVGDQMPDWKFTPLVNGKESLQLRQLKGKALMFCFWSSTCGGSLNMLPKAKELEGKFGKEFMPIFIVDDKDSAKPVALMHKRPDLESLGIPLMKRDTALLKLFPHNGGPHIVLISKTGEIKAITGGTYANEKYLADLLAGNDLKLPVRKIEKPHENTLLEDGLLASKNVLFQSVMTGYTEELAENSGSVMLPGKKFRLKADNTSMIQLYIWAYTGEIHFETANPLKRIILEAKDKKRWGLGIEDPLATDHKYCYELTMPATAGVRRSAFAYMKQDLDRYFNVSARVETRRTKCFLLVANENIGTLLEDPNDAYTQQWPGKSALHNEPLNAVAATLNKAWKEELIISEAESQKRYSLDVPNEYKSFRTLEKDMAAKGFTLVPVERELKFLVLTEK